jgi:hypothetical protein
VSAHPLLVSKTRNDGYFFFAFLAAAFFFGAAFFAFFIQSSWTSRGIFARSETIYDRLPEKRGGERCSTPPSPGSPYFFFFVAFLAAFFFAGILKIPPFGPNLDFSRPTPRCRVMRTLTY